MNPAIFYFLVDPLIISKSKLFQNLFIPLCSISFSSIIIILTYAKSSSLLVTNIGTFGANISYSMYLFHIFFIPLTVNFLDNLILSLLIYIASLKIFCWIFFIFFEKPILESRPKYI